MMAGEHLPTLRDYLSGLRPGAGFEVLDIAAQISAIGIQFAAAP